MNIKVKFYMMFNCGEIQIRTLDDLRENFCVEDVLTNFEDGRLEKWLDVWNYEPELEAVRGLKASGKTNAREVFAELMRIFGAGMDEAEIDSGLDVYDYVEERKQFWEYMRSNGLQELEELRKRCADLQKKVETLESERDKSKIINAEYRTPERVSETLKAFKKIFVDSVALREEINDKYSKS